MWPVFQLSAKHKEVSRLAWSFDKRFTIWPRGVTSKYLLIGAFKRVLSIVLKIVLAAYMQPEITTISLKRTNKLTEKEAMEYISKFLVISLFCWSADS